MKNPGFRTALLPVTLAAVMVSGCSKTNPNTAQNAQNASPQATNQNQPAQQAVNPEATPTPQSAYAPQSAPPQQQAYAPPRQPAYAPPRQQAYAPAPAPRPVAAAVIPAGTHIVVTLGQSISSKTAQPGDSFNATVAEPVVVRGQTLIRAGAPASGTVVDAKSLGHFKGQAELAIRLDSVRAEGRSYQVSSSTVERAEKGKGKRTATLVGGGAGLGALIGGLAGGGKGLAIGALSGAGAGTAGSAFTGNKELVIPAETELTFRLERDVPLR